MQRYWPFFFKHSNALAPQLVKRHFRIGFIALEWTNVLGVGIPIPSTDLVFLTFVIIHIAISLVAVVTGLIAMFAEKTSIRHKRNDSIYFWSISFSFLTIIILS